MLTLYHYTPSANLTLIAKTLVLRRSTIIGRNRQLLGAGAVSLTSDPDGYGHGLPDGREINLGNHSDVKSDEYTLVAGKAMWNDHRDCRIELGLLATDANLVKVSDYYAHDLEIMRGLEVSAILPLDRPPPQEAINAVKARLAEEDLPPFGKGHTWYYYLQDIPLVTITVTRWDAALRAYL